MDYSDPTEIESKLHEHSQQLDNHGRKLTALAGATLARDKLLVKIHEFHQQDEALAFLRQEYFHVSSIQDNFDQKALTIKAWSVTFSMVGIGAGFYYRIPVLLILSGLASLLFWIIEAYYKKNQKCYYHRLNEIEEAMRSYLEDNSRGLRDFPRISTSWNQARIKVNVLERALRLHVMLPHLPVVLVGLVAGVVLYLCPELIDHQFLGGGATRSTPFGQ